MLFSYCKPRVHSCISMRLLVYSISPMIWSDMEPSDLTRTNVNLRVPREVAIVFDKP